MQGGMIQVQKPEAPASLGRRVVFAAAGFVSLVLAAGFIYVGVPRYVAVCRDLGITRELPWPTRVIIQISNAVTLRFPLLLLAGMVIGGAVVALALMVAGICPVPRRTVSVIAYLAIPVLIFILALVTLALPLTQVTSSLQSGLLGAGE